MQIKITRPAVNLPAFRNEFPFRNIQMCVTCATIEATARLQFDWPPWNEFFAW